MRIVGGAGKLGHAFGEFRRAGCAIAQAVERFGEAVEIVDGLGLAGERHRGDVGVQCADTATIALGLAEAAERCQEGARRHVVQDQGRRAVRDEKPLAWTSLYSLWRQWWCSWQPVCNRGRANIICKEAE